MGKEDVSMSECVCFCLCLCFCFLQTLPPSFPGPTGSGKSFYALDLIKHRASMIDPPHQKCVFIYSVYQEIFDTINDDDVKFIEGSEASNLSPEQLQDCLVIYDDQQTQKELDSFLTKIFTIFSHHYNISVESAVHWSMCKDCEFQHTLFIDPQHIVTLGYLFS